MTDHAFYSALRLVVLSGGDSAEREISLRSGAAVAAALERAGHDAVPVDPAETPLQRVDWALYDACFIALHGGAGEDGRVQDRLESLGVPFTGSRGGACRLAMRKSASKERFVERGVPTLEYELIGPDEAIDEVSRRVARLRYPLVVKPDCQGSSIGVCVARSHENVADCVAQARVYDRDCLVEPLVAGREFTVAVLDERPLPTIEIVTPEPVFSYQAKYQSSLTEYRFDFVLSSASRAEIVEAAVAAARALGTAGLARVDIMRSHEGDVSVLEVNTVPGMTPRSLAPLAAARAGIDMVELCDWMVRQCLAPAGVS
jgi:D-alanine-D-alanine ligase